MYTGNQQGYCCLVALQMSSCQTDITNFLLLEDMQRNMSLSVLFLRPFLKLKYFSLSFFFGSSQASNDKMNADSIL